MENPGCCNCARCECPGITGTLLTWTGDRDFTADRDVTQFPGWREIYRPENWCEDPGETTFLWRIVMDDTETPGAENDKQWHMGAIRDWTMYRYFRFGNNTEPFPGSHLPGDERGFNVDNGGYWDFTGGNLTGEYSWRLEIGTARRLKSNGTLCGFCGIMHWPAGPFDDSRLNAGCNDLDDLLLRDEDFVVKWSGDTLQPDVPADWQSPIGYAANGSSSPWSSPDQCSTGRLRWDSDWLTHGQRTGYLNGTLQARAQHLAVSDISNVPAIVLTGGNFGMSRPDANDQPIVREGYDPATYTPDVSRILEWLDLGDKILCISPVYFGRVFGGRPEPSFHEDNIWGGGVGYIDHDTVPATEMHNGSGSKIYTTDPTMVWPYIGASLSAPIEHTNRLWGALEVTSRIANHGLVPGTMIDIGGFPVSIPTKVNPNGPQSIEIRALTTDDDVSHGTGVGLPQCYQFTPGADVTHEVRFNVRMSSTIDSIVLSDDWFPCACMETRGTSRIYVSSMFGHSEVAIGTFHDVAYDV